MRHLFPEVSGTRPEYFTVKCCEPLSSAFVPPTGSFCLLELWPLESLNCRPSPIVDRCRDRLRDFPTPSRSRSISSVKVSDLREVLAELRIGPSIAFTYLQSM